MNNELNKNQVKVVKLLEQNGFKITIEKTFISKAKIKMLKNDYSIITEIPYCVIECKSYAMMLINQFEMHRQLTNTRI